MTMATTDIRHRPIAPGAPSARPALPSGLPRPIGRRDLALLVIGAIAIGLFCIYATLGLTAGHNWGDDFGLYLQLAENMRTGRPYNDMNTGVRVPPGFPLIVAAAMEIGGTGLREIKVVNVVSWALAAAVASMLAARLLGVVAALLMLTMVLMLPAYVFLQQTINTDIPFALFAVATLALAIAYMRVGDWRRYLLLAPLAALFLYGLLIRPAGLPLAAGIVGGCLLTAIHRRSLRRDLLPLVAVVVVVAAVLAINSVMFGASAGDHTTVAMRALRAAGATLPEAIVNTVIRRSADEWRNFNLLFFGFPIVPLKGATLLAYAVAGGVIYIVRTRDWVVPTFAAAYAAMILVTPWDGGPRYLLPIVPAVILFIAAPFSLAAGMFGRDRRPAVRAAFAVVAVVTLALPVSLASQTVAGARDLRGFDDNQIATEATRQMIEAVKTHAAPDEMVCSPKPRAVMYLAKRRGCVMPRQLPGTAAAYLVGQKAALAVLFTSEDEVAFRQLDETVRQEAAMREVFRNSHYAVYRLATTP